MNTDASSPDDPRFPAMPVARAVAFAAFFAALVPAPILSVDAWAVAERIVAPESGSPRPGRWDPELAPHLVEIHECVSDGAPYSDTWVRKSAQISGTEAGLNLFGATVQGASPTRPRPIVIILPTIDEAKKYNKIKLQPTIDATPALAGRIEGVKSRDSDSSTGSHKRFPNGFCVLTGANSSAGLQMVSAHTMILEEVSEYPQEAGDRGDPVDQALARAKAWETYRPKRLYISTPGILGSCRITQGEAASDQRRRYLPCPHCGRYQQLLFGNMRFADAAPFGTHFVCQAAACEQRIEHHHKEAMLDAGVWIKTYPDADGVVPPAVIAPEALPAWRARDSAGRDAGFAIWQAYSKLGTWDRIAKEFLDSRGKPLKEKAFSQQTLGEAWEERGDAPDAERLLERRESWPPRQVPTGVLLLTAGADVQDDRLEWYVWGWGVGLSGWLVDRGVVAGDPADPATWKGLDPLVERAWRDARGGRWTLDAIGIDSGYLSQQVYRWGRRHAASGKVFVLDPLGGWKRPPLGTASPRDIDYEGRKLGSVLAWPVGTYDLKSEHYASLRKTIEGPDADGTWPLGALHLNELVDQEITQQLTAEMLKSRPLSNGLVAREWVKIVASRRNEALDCAVYARALAHHLTDSLTPEDWAALAARRGAQAEDVQRDLAALWAPPLPATVAEASQPGETAGAAAGQVGTVAAAPVETPVEAAPRGRSVRGRVTH
ncbi:terminase [Allostella vacuolata]|nr:terminase [Stella vacuolata]